MSKRKQHNNIGLTAGICVLVFSLCSCSQQSGGNRPNYTYSSVSNTTSSTATSSVSEADVVSSEQKELDEAVRKYQGEYERTDESGVLLIISGTDVNYIIESEYNGKHTDMRFINHLTFDSNGDIIVVFPSGEKRYKAILDGSTLRFDSEGSGNADMQFTKVSDNTELPPQRGEPKLGMTKEEILNTTWADNPYNTGILTTENGIAETWYYEWGDISFVNDVVVLINEGAVNQAPDSGGGSQIENDGYIHVGDSFIRGNLQFTFVSYDNNCTDYATGFSPKDGYKYIRLKMSIKNIGSTNDSIYSMFFTCYADNKQAEKLSGLEFKEQDGFSTISNRLSPNREANASLYFEIPINSKNVEVEYSSDELNAYFVLKCQ